MLMSGQRFVTRILRMVKRCRSLWGSSNMPKTKQKKNSRHFSFSMQFCLGPPPPPPPFSYLQPLWLWTSVPRAARNWLCGGGMAWAPGEGGGGGGAFQKWASVPGPLFCVRTDVAAKGAGTQILARKIWVTSDRPTPHDQVTRKHRCVAERGQRKRACQCDGGSQSGTQQTLRPKLSPKATMP